MGYGNAVVGQHRLIGAEAKLAERLRTTLIDVLDKHLSLEAGDGFLLLYRSGRLVDPDQIPDLVSVGKEIHDALVRALRSPEELAT